jgi:murein DD-endopeptidase MepM/ murein hydrolase activator NlpD
MMYCLAIVRRLLFLLLIFGCTPLGSSSPARVARQGAYHVVKPGENLFRIAKAYDLTYEELARANDIKDPRHILVGQKIFIPGRAQPRPIERTAAADSASRSGSRGEVAETVFLWPVSGSLNSGFGPRGSGFHDGLDIAAPEGTPIRSVEHGEVIYSDQLRGYGNMVIVRHSGGIASVYAHNQVNLVREGQQVARGEVIARVGSTGRVTGPHLHFEIRKDNLAQDPLLYLPQLCCIAASDMVTPKD